MSDDILRVLMGAFLLSMACAEASIVPAGDMGAHDVLLFDDVLDAKFPTVDTVVPSEVLGEVALDGGEVEVVEEVIEDTGAAPCDQGEGCFLEPCTVPDDCLSGFCVDHLNESVCTKTCELSCPQGWECTAVSSGADVTYICVSPHTHLCRPCVDAEDCKSVTGVEDVCVQYGSNGSFCGSQCKGDEDCPAGFVCADALTSDGLAVTQCVKVEGECECGSKDVDLGVWTPCVLENENGVCGGKRSCTDQGLSACVVQDNEPLACAVENEAGSCPGNRVCLEDGMSDCEVDQSVKLECEVTNDFGTCAGLRGCTATGPGVCDGDEPVQEICNGLDDNCDGAIDEDTCVDESPCVLSSCNAALAQCEVGFLNGAECIDGDVCTVSDKCLGADCLGDPINCTDGNPCTDDLGCDPSDGCLYAFNAEPCDDDDVCTVGDACEDGACAVGALGLNCDDKNSCTTDSCVDPDGCDHLTLPDGTDCENKGLCSEGECKPPIQANCRAWLQVDPDAQTGKFAVDPDGEDGELPVMDVYCDMETDGGGWTLVLRDSLDGIIPVNNMEAGGNTFFLQLEDGPSAKFSDVVMNALRSHQDERMTWRTTSKSLQAHYFFPGSCVYKHISHNDPQCMRFAPSYKEDEFPSYNQCEVWGGSGGGLNAWYGCGPPGVYTNVVKTHSDFFYGGACMTSNPSGAELGNKGGGQEVYPVSGCTYGNKVSVWVR